jgi:hypothetical protein
MEFPGCCPSFPPGFRDEKSPEARQHQQTAVSTGHRLLLRGACLPTGVHSHWTTPAHRVSCHHHPPRTHPVPRVAHSPIPLRQRGVRTGAPRWLLPARYKETWTSEVLRTGRKGRTRSIGWCLSRSAPSYVGRPGSSASFGGGGPVHGSETGQLGG